jgi:threonine dehydrogenase-like Zn-dependent dehydrogenase
VYDGPRDVVVKDVPDAKIEHPTDVLVKITTTNICASDLHMYEGRTDLEPGMVLGHENLGIVCRGRQCGCQSIARGSGVCALQHRWRFLP